MMKSLWAALILSLTLISFGTADEPSPPEIITAGPQTRPLQLPDGSLRAYFSRFGKLFALTSSNGIDWTEPAAEFDLPFESMGGGLSLLDSEGEVHVILTHARGEGKPADTRFIDLWHCCTYEVRTRWGKPQRIWEGYCGAVMDFKQLRNGLLVVPFAAWKKPGEIVAPDTGSNYTTVVTSTHGGSTWELSPSRLTAPCYAGYNGNNYGAIEPTILQLKDDRVWMLMRSQTGFLYESFSEDGINWSTAHESRFHSSTSPAALVRLPDERIVIVWNNCEQPPKYESAGVYGGRDALHAAISADEGTTWRGFREVYRDPFRNETPPRSGDRGTAYPVAFATRDGSLLIASGQGGRRHLIRLDPEWLTQTKQRETFENDLAEWHVWKPFGPASGYWRDRTTGPTLIEHPDRMNARVLHIRKPDGKTPDCATWNFPAGERGELTLRVLARKDSQGFSLAFNDRFFNPTDDRGEKESGFVFRFATVGISDEVVTLPPDQWHTLKIEWDIGRNLSQAALDGKVVSRGKVNQDLFGGVSYLRIRSTATNIDEAGVLIESIEASVVSK
jgi:BNR repeat-like domain